MDDILDRLDQREAAVVPSAPRAKLAELTEPSFKAVPTTHARKGLRLERAFWQALSTIAGWSGVRRHRLVADIVEQAEKLELNSASALRSYAIDTMEAEVTRLRELNGFDYAVSLLQQAPVPSFAVDSDKRLVRVNPEFNHFVRILFAETGTATARGSLQLNLETPVAEVFAQLGQSGEGKQFMLNVVADGKSRRTRTRIVAVPPHDPQGLVGYILP